MGFLSGLAKALVPGIGVAGAARRAVKGDLRGAAGSLAGSMAPLSGAGYLAKRAFSRPTPQSGAPPMGAPAPAPAPGQGAPWAGGGASMMAQQAGMGMRRPDAPPQGGEDAFGAMKSMAMASPEPLQQQAAAMGMQPPAAQPPQSEMGRAIGRARMMYGMRPRLGGDVE